jgi:hypothetical protein
MSMSLWHAGSTLQLRCKGAGYVCPWYLQVVYGLIRQRRQEMARGQITGGAEVTPTRTDLLHSLLAARDEDGSGKYMLPHFLHLMAWCTHDGARGCSAELQSDSGRQHSGHLYSVGTCQPTMDTGCVCRTSCSAIIPRHWVATLLCLLSCCRHE